MQVGHKLPFRDLWAANVSLLVKQYDFPPLLTLDDLPPIPKLPKKNMLISANIKAAADEFVVCWFSWTPDGKPFKLSPQVYKATPTGGYREEFEENHLRKYRRFVKTATAADTTLLRETWANTQGKLRPHIYETAFRGLTNALPTEHRRACGGAFTIPARAHAPNPWPCSFCLVGPN
jgi:hypothetical protein